MKALIERCWIASQMKQRQDEDPASVEGVVDGIRKPFEDRAPNAPWGIYASEALWMRLDRVNGVARRCQELSAEAVFLILKPL